MDTRVWFEEWRLGDDRITLRVGDPVAWDVERCTTSWSVELDELIGEWATPIVYAFIDSSPATTTLRGHVTAIHAVTVTCETPRGGLIVPGSAVVESAATAAPIGGNGRRLNGRVVLAYLLDVTVTESAANPRHRTPIEQREVDLLIRSVYDLLVQLRPQLSDPIVQLAQTLIDNEEPNEALLQIAWDIATRGIDVPQQVLAFIDSTVGDRHDLPQGLARHPDTSVRRTSN